MSADSDLSKKEGLVCAGGWLGFSAVTSGALLEFTPGVRRPGKDGTRGTSPARQPATPSTLAALSGVTSHPVCSTVLWPGSCPVPTAQPLALEKELGERSELVG